MKKYLIKIALFFVAIAVVDFIFGIACQYMNDHSKGGGIKSRYYVCKEANEEVLVFGSSRAKHHYVPDIIKDSLGIACYNTGEDGNGIIFCYGILKMVTQRYAPKLIIYDLSEFDIYQDDNEKYLDLLKPYYFEPGIDEVFWTIEPQNRLLMYSNLYRFNSNCLSILGNYLYPLAYYPSGYAPHFFTMEEPKTVNMKLKSANIDTLKLSFFEKFIALAKDKNIKMVCCISPFYKSTGDAISYSSLQKIMLREEIPLFNFSHIPEISENYRLFKDQSHMNNEGAQLYTSILVSKIKYMLDNQKR